MSLNSRAFHSLTESNGNEGSVARVCSVFTELSYNRRCPFEC